MKIFHIFSLRLLFLAIEQMSRIHFLLKFHLFLFKYFNIPVSPVYEIFVVFRKCLVKKIEYLFAAHFTPHSAHENRF